MTKASTPEGRLRAKIMVLAKKSGWDDATIYTVASEVIGRTLSKGWGLSTCDKPELIRILDRVVIETGGTPAPHRRGRPWGSGEQDGVVVIASLESLHLIRGLQDELRMTDPELAGVVWRATKQRTRRVKTAHEARVTIEALWAIRERRLKTAAHDDQDPSGNRQSAIDNLQSEAP